jgi:superoxide dismutase, Cu-Zn family
MISGATKENIMRLILALTLTVSIAVPASAEVLGLGKNSASATILDAGGVPIGKAKLTRSKKHGLRLSVAVRGLTRGERGVHLHAVGRCEGPNFASAGPHLNPANKQHGLENATGSHQGDLPNMLVNRKGRGTLSYDIADGRLKGGVMDEDGLAIVIHAKSDDQRTDPSGNSGDRVACGVFLND